MKLKTVIISLVILTAAIALTVGSLGMTNGGGMFIDQDGHMVTFGFNVKTIDKETFQGEFELVDHGTGQKIHVSEMQGVLIGTNVAIFQGITEDGVTVVVFEADYDEPGPDAGDYIEVYYCDLQQLSWSGHLVKGNIQIRD
jgi:hypothetical protein